MDIDAWDHDSTNVKDDLRKLKRTRARRYENSTLYRFTMQVALCIGLSQRCDFNHSVNWIFQKRRRWAPDLPEDVSRSELLKEIEDAFMQLTEDELRSWSNPHISNWPPSVYVEADRYLRDQALALGVHNINRNKGLTVRSELLLDLVNTVHQPAFDAEAAVVHLNPKTDSSQRSWGYRWRKRIRGFISCFSNRPRLTMDETREKVSRHNIFLLFFFQNKVKFRSFFC